MKKWIFLLMAACMMLALCACGAKTAGNTEPQASPEEDLGGQNPVMNFVGAYQSDRARATVACSGTEDAQIVIEWADSASELAKWEIVGRLDPENLTISYSGCTKSILHYDGSGEVTSQEAEYEDGTGTIVFREDGSFTWHEDQSDRENDLVFEWAPVTEG